ncbi:MAG: LysM peptidoglycan-binding domain-containing protein [Nitrospirota bacterium]
MRRTKSLVSGTIPFLIFFILSSSAFAQEQQYKDYTIIKGDTLWDITDKELQDPFLWPKVWKENPDIKNPDLIYPKQTIKIPLFLLQKEIVPEVRPMAKPMETPEPPREIPKIIEPQKIDYLVNKPLLISSGYIAETIPNLGAITETPFGTGKTILGKNDEAYIEPSVPVKKGDRFYIIRPMQKVMHPRTGDFMGYLIDVVGIAEVVNDIDPKILITDSYWEVTIGDLLAPYYEIEPPLAMENPRKPEINGYVVAAKQSRLISVEYEVAYIDRGRRDGLRVGDILATLKQSKHRIENGIIQVISLQEKTATVIVRKSHEEVVHGDPVLAAK